MRKNIINNFNVRPTSTINGGRLRETGALRYVRFAIALSLVITLRQHSRGFYSACYKLDQVSILTTVSNLTPFSEQ